jgi:predicted Zn-dependent peptidase
MHKKITLKNGIRVMLEPMDYMRSASIGFWIKVGSINETSALNGVSHFIEHMLFKGTTNRTAKTIAGEIDDLGGELNAFTSKECTCIYTHVLSEHVSLAIDIISDMLMNSVFDPAEIEKEKMIVLDEINLYDDTPEELVYDLLSEITFKGHALQRPILGTKKSVSSLTREVLLQYFELHYQPENMVVAVSGNYNEAEVIEVLESTIGKMDQIKQHVRKVANIPFCSGYTDKKKDFEQMHLIIGFKGYGYDTAELYPFLLLNNVVGGVSSSRLFQKIREDYGLSYTIDSQPSFYYDSGMFTIYASMLPENLDKVSELILEELKLLKAGNLNDEEVIKFRNQLKGSFVLGMEGPTNIMNWIGKSELLSGRIRPLDEVISGIEAITKEDVLRQINEIFDPHNMAVTLVGKTGKYK